jgi:DnaJ-class molecular chaperone
VAATRPRDYYEVLGVPRTATQKDIKSAFRKLARQYHPDVTGNDPEATRKFKEINEAHEVLADPEKRKRYDNPEPEPSFGGGDGGFQYRTVDPEDLEDLFGSDSPFSDFFNERFGGAARPARGFASVPLAGEDVEGETSISLEEAYRGTTRKVRLRTDQGSREVEVKIPPGIRDGARVRVAGQGGRGANGGPAGDLYIRVHIEPHPQFRRDGDDLHVKVAVPLATALLGGEVTVPTVKGTRVALKVPPETQNGTRLRLRGLGMPRRRGSVNGDLYAEVDVRLPLPLTPEMHRLAEQIRELTGG